mmetsp:Transcript_61826/g.135408  ORF Transcript_61826/g.135408 Transcript_61826/m.135408 type:complete len:258 (-) Transcript_61826:2095-2868(-)
MRIESKKHPKIWGNCLAVPFWVNFSVPGEKSPVSWVIPSPPAEAGVAIRRAGRSSPVAPRGRLPWPRPGRAGIGTSPESPTNTSPQTNALDLWQCAAPGRQPWMPWRSASSAPSPRCHVQQPAPEASSRSWVSCGRHSSPAGTAPPRYAPSAPPSARHCRRCRCRHRSWRGPRRVDGSPAGDPRRRPRATGNSRHRRLCWHLHQLTRVSPPAEQHPLVLHTAEQWHHCHRRNQNLLEPVVAGPQSAHGHARKPHAVA